jgi:hypothetical protein
MRQFSDGSCLTPRSQTRVISHLAIGYLWCRSDRRAVLVPRPVELSDGRRPSVRLTSTNIAAASTTPGPDLTELPRIGARTLIPAVNPTEERLATAHRAKLAYVYVRLVWQHQVRSAGRSGVGNTGLVVSLDASRLARNNRVR